MCWDVLCFSFLLKRSNFTFILAQLGIGDNQFPLKSCRDGKWGLPSLEMNFYLPDCFFYNELVNDPGAENVSDSSFSDHLTSFPFPSAAERTAWRKSWTQLTASTRRVHLGLSTMGGHTSQGCQSSTPTARLRKESAVLAWRVCRSTHISLKARCSPTPTFQSSI